MRRLASVLIALMIAGGCGSNGEPSTTSARSGRPTGSVAASPAPALVGEWQRLQSCSELEGPMNQAGLHDALLQTVADDRWIPGVTSVEQIKDPAHPCMGAVPRMHSHFFTADGEFGSRDEYGRQVDEGNYVLEGDDTVRIGGVTFHYKITNNDTLELTPVIPDCAPTCFEAGWSVAVANPGHPWMRVR